MTQERIEAIDALDRIFNYCEEIDHHIPEEERTGYKMYPDVEKISTFLRLTVSDLTERDIPKARFQCRCGICDLDLNEFMGTWYEIARFDHSFERGMDNTMAQYILQDDGKVVVLNTGWKNGKFKLAEGKAKYPDPQGEPGALRVSFFLQV